MNLTTNARYILPGIIEKTSGGMQYSSDIYSKLLKERIVFLSTQIDDVSANDVMAQLLYLESEDPDRDIVLYINSPGGSMSAFAAIYDTMQFIKPDVQTVCMGQAASAAALLLGAGAPGKRFALQHSRIMIHQPSGGESYGQVSDIQIYAAEIQRMRELLEQVLVTHTKRTAEQVKTDIERDKFLTSAEALDYGLIDEVITTRKISSLTTV